MSLINKGSGGGDERKDGFQRKAECVVERSERERRDIWGEKIRNTGKRRRR